MRFGTHFQGALSLPRVAFVAYMFVDDTYFIETTKYSCDDFKDVGNQMQRALDLLSGMIKATSGALVLKKCSGTWLTSTGWMGNESKCHMKI